MPTVVAGRARECGGCYCFGVLLCGWLRLWVLQGRVGVEVPDPDALRWPRLPSQPLTWLAPVLVTSWRDRAFSGSSGMRVWRGGRGCACRGGGCGSRSAMIGGC